MVNRRSLSRCGMAWALVSLVLLLTKGAYAAGAGPIPAGTTGASLTRVRFQLRSECTCTACGYALQQQLRKAPGITRVDLSPRERMVTVAFDEGRLPLSRVAALVASTELGKHSALIGDLPDARTSLDLAAKAHVAGVRAVEVSGKKGRLLIELAEGAAITTAELTASLAKADVAVRFDSTGRANGAARATSIR
jgi:copper chaperone CopZ